MSSDRDLNGEAKDYSVSTPSSEDAAPPTSINSDKDTTGEVSCRKELWLVTKTNDADFTSSRDAQTTRSGNGSFGENVTTSRKISSLEELKEAISWLEGPQSPNPQALSDHDRQRVSYSDYHYNTTLGYTNTRSHSDNTAVSNRVFLDEVKRFELFRSVIQHEDDLLNQRVSWIILAQSFLMAAYITASTDDGQNHSLKYIAAIVGLLTVIVTMPAILAAGRNIELQQRVYFAHIGSEERCIELHGHGRDLHTRRSKAMMRREHTIRMRDGHIFPNMAFRGRGAVPIVFTVVALAVVQVAGWILLLVALGMEW